MSDYHRKASVSHYGLITSGRAHGEAYVDLFVPELLLKQLEIRPGSKVILQGLADADKDEFYLRARSGLETVNAAHTPFTASIRFKNEPKILARFLALANEKEVDFKAIRTFGYRGTDESDLVFEGSVPDRQHHFVYRQNLKTLLEQILDGLRNGENGELQATVISHEVLRFKEIIKADVGSTVYRLDVPVLRDRFLKVRIPVSGKTTERFSETQLTLARLNVEFDSMTIAIKTDLGQKNTFLLVFDGRDLEEGYPVTSTILKVLPDGVNVDAISAYEYVAFDSEADDPRQLKAMGRIEMLCVTPELIELDHAGVQRQLVAAIGDILKDAKRIRLLRFEPVYDAFSRLQNGLAANDDGINLGASETSAVRVFNEAFNDRYVRLGRLGGGSSGVVYRYLDLQERRMVAGKHFPDARIGSAELKTLVDRSFGPEPAKQIKNLPRLHDYFFADSIPVIVTELLPVILGNHERSPYRDEKVDSHQHPNTLREFAQMATQVCTALESLHSRRADETGAIACLHGDVKPANIGAAIEKGKLVWKLIDFGLAKAFGGDTTRSQDRPIGTPSHMSPDAGVGPRTPAIDIFALGVTFFEVLCDWRHPGIQEDGSPYPAEVMQYLEYLKQKTGTVPSGYDPGTFHLGAPFNQEKVRPELIAELRDIVFGMLRMSVPERIGSATLIKERIISWASKLKR